MTLCRNAGFLLAVLWLCASGLTRAQDLKDPGPLIKEALESDNLDRQRAALVLIPEIRDAISKETAPAQMARIAKFLDDYAKKTSNEENRVLAILAYGKLYPSASAANGALRGHLTSGSVPVRRAVGKALVEVANTTARDFGRPLISTPASAGTIGSSAGSMAAVVWLRAWVGGKLNDEQGFIRFGDDSRILLALATIALNDVDDEVKRSGSEVMRTLAKSTADTLPDPALSSSETKIIDPVEAKLKWLLLQPVFEALNSAIPSLKNALSSNNKETRLAAVRATDAICQARAMALATRRYPPDDLGSFIGTVPTEDSLKTGVDSILPTLAERLDDKAPDIRLTAIEAFEHQGAAASAQLDAIIKASNNPDLFVRWVASRALGRMFMSATPEAKIKIANALTARIDDPDMDIRAAALVSLGKGKTAGRPATNAILKLAAEDDPDQAALAIKTLSQIEAEHSLTVPALTKALSSPLARVRKAAVMYLGTTGKDAQPSLPQIRRLLFDVDEEVRRETAKALLVIE